jgi:hypothetical protein
MLFLIYLMLLCHFFLRPSTLPSAHVGIGYWGCRCSVWAVIISLKYSRSCARCSLRLLLACSLSALERGGRGQARVFRPGSRSGEFGGGGSDAVLSLIAKFLEITAVGDEVDCSRGHLWGEGGVPDPGQLGAAQFPCL